MILFGKKDKHLATEQLPKEVCEACGKRGGVVSIFQIYFHVLLLPVIPVSRKTASQCLKCNKIKVEEFFSETQLEVSNRLKANHKTPLWALVGAAVLFLFLLGKLLLKWT